MTMQISDEEFAIRVKRAQAAMASEKLDVLIAFGNEAEPQYVRYFSDYWPSFETALVFIPGKGNAVLLIGPESLTFASAWSRIGRIERIKVLRESSEPEYPGEKLNTLYHLLEEHLDETSQRRIGIVGYSFMSAPVYKTICETAVDHGCDVVRADKMIIDMKMVKSHAEIDIMRHAAQISEKAMGVVLGILHPGMTEAQVVGEAEREIRSLGAENEAYPMWCLSGANTRHAIGRPDADKTIRQGELVQLQFGARVAGYASSIGRPIAMRGVRAEILELMEIGLEAHWETIRALRAGIPANEVSKAYEAVLARRGAKGCNLYGPCHGTGLMEGEHPWIESNSDYILKENVSYCVDTFLRREDYGLRWEDQVVLLSDSAEMFTNKHLEVMVV